MELSKLHSTVIAVMKDRGSSIAGHEQLLSVIGDWYQRWLASGVRELVLRVPSYNKELLASLMEYQYWLDLLIRICTSSQATELSGYGLFDLRAYRTADRYQRQRTDFVIGHLSSDLRSHRFDQEVCVSTDRFLPLFRTEQITGRKELVADVFSLLAVLGRENIISHAITLDLEQDLTLFIKQSAEHLAERAFMMTLCTDDFRKDDDRQDAVLDGLLDIDFQRVITITYPYHVDISSTVINEFRVRSKLFRVALSNRFAHGEVDEHEVILTRSEIGLSEPAEIVKVIERFSVKDTKCSPLLITELRALKYEWNQSKLNVFSNPFPVKWLLCINHGRTISFWKAQFKKDYPEVSGQLLTIALNIIDLIFELNWIDKHLLNDGTGTLVLPKSAFHAEVILSLKEHMLDRFDQVVLSDELEQVLAGCACVYLLDPFNIILLNNISLGNHSENFLVVVPDFLYYTYQPFISYLALRYLSDAWTGGLRTVLDKEHPVRSTYWKELVENTLSSCKKDIRQFNRRMSVNDTDDGLNEPAETNADLSAAELVDQLAVKERKVLERLLPKRIEITTSERSISVRPNAPVVINQNGVLIKTIAAVLEQGALFVAIEEMIKNLDLKKMIDRLITLSVKAKNWHQYLNTLALNDPGIFEQLKDQGLSISKLTFQKDYLISDESSGELHMPRAKKDWMIVCERLQITDSHTAWNAIKCQGDINQLKAVYSQIIELMTNTGSFGINVSDSVLDQVTTLLSRLPNPSDNAKENKMDAVALINEICGKINLEKIEQIENISYEPITEPNN